MKKGADVEVDCIIHTVWSLFESATMDLNWLSDNSNSSRISPDLRKLRQAEEKPKAVRMRPGSSWVRRSSNEKLEKNSFSTGNPAKVLTGLQHITNYRMMFVVDLPRDELTSGWCHWLDPGWHNHNHQKTRVSPSTGNGIIATALTFLSMSMENSRANKWTSRTQMIFYNPPIWKEPRWCASLAFVLQMYSAPKHTSRSISG